MNYEVAGPPGANYPSTSLLDAATLQPNARFYCLLLMQKFFSGTDFVSARAVDDAGPGMRASLLATNSTRQFLVVLSTLPDAVTWHSSLLVANATAWTCNHAAMFPVRVSSTSTLDFDPFQLFVVPKLT